MNREECRTHRVLIVRCFPIGEGHSCLREGGSPLADPSPERGRADRDVAANVRPARERIALAAARLSEAAEGIRGSVRLCGQVANRYGQTARDNENRKRLSELALETAAPEGEGLLDGQGGCRPARRLGGASGPTTRPQAPEPVPQSTFVMRMSRPGRRGRRSRRASRRTRSSEWGGRSEEDAPSPQGEVTHSPARVPTPVPPHTQTARGGRRRVEQ